MSLVSHAPADAQHQPGEAAAPRAADAADAADAVASRATSAPPRPTAPASPAPTAAPQAGSQPATADAIGTVQPIPVDTHSSAQVRSVAEALQTGTHPERLNALNAPAPFLLAVFQASPQAYIDEVVPGRVYQTAQPGPGIPALRSLGPTSLTLAQDGQTILRTKSTPGGVISYTSFDLGRFSNNLTSQTVIADANGVGSVAFTPGPGTIDAVNVLAGSPMATGQVAFRIVVTVASTTPSRGISP